MPQRRTPERGSSDRRGPTSFRSSSSDRRPERRGPSERFGSSSGKPPELRKRSEGAPGFSRPSRPSFGDSRGRSPRGEGFGRSERPSFGARRGPSSGGSRFDRSSGDRPFHKPSGDRPSFGGRGGGFSKPGFERGGSGRSGFSPRPGFGSRSSFGDKPSFGNRPSFGGKPSFGGRSSFGSKPSFRSPRPERPSSGKSIDLTTGKLTVRANGEAPTPRPERTMSAGHPASARPERGERKPFDRKREGDFKPRMNSRGDSRSTERRTHGPRPVQRVERRGAPTKIVKRGEPKSTVPDFLLDQHDEQKTVRLNKFIAASGISSRRKADELITAGAVTINGVVVTELGVQVKPYQDLITVNGGTISLRPRYVYYLLNKPKDTITTTNDEKDRTTVLDYIKTSERVYPIGRLDRNTTGVLLVSNDGELTNRLTHPSYEIEREYQVTLDKPMKNDDARKMAEGGVDIGDGDMTGAADVSVGKDDPKDVLIRLREGKNREVRRLFETFGYEVEKLDRISFAGLTHRGMGRGDSRTLTPSEIKQLRRLVGLDTGDSY